ncbi:MAG: hypothetical protein NUW07_00045 [Candidatus Saccharicenans sp.]|jgi:hypothetical protein|nr:hypothetical protein [Candidatus Saccharicenans sp.]MDH7493148.1 hypothetical protein [Candidatus Saccharicenans sp.]
MLDQSRPGLLASLFLLSLTVGFQVGLSPDSTGDILVDQVVEKAYQRLVSYQDFGRWQALVVSSQTSADRHWQPEKTRRVTKRMTFEGGLLDEEILEAVEIEKGRTRDITEAYRQQRLESLRKLREERERSRASGSGLELSLEDLIPFSEKNRSNYRFGLLGEAELDGERVVLLEARARVKKDFLFEGLFYLAGDSYDLRRLEITPVKTPGFIREFKMEVDLALWQERLVMKKVRIKIYGRFLFKSVRRLIEEEYSDYQPLD